MEELRQIADGAETQAPLSIYLTKPELEHVLGNGVNLNYRHSGTTLRVQSLMFSCPA